DNADFEARVDFSGLTNQRAREKEANMIIVGCDYHPGFQQIAFVDTDTGELQERRLQHREEAEKFYRDLATQGMKVRVGMEASRHARWFERLLGELHDFPRIWVPRWENRDLRQLLWHRHRMVQARTRIMNQL